MLNLRPATPVNPGPDGARKGSALKCNACGSQTANRAPRVVGRDIVAMLCVDAAECCKRYRRGASPESYAAALRGEILAAA